MEILDKKSTKFLYNYLNNFSPTGYEAEGQKMWLDYIKPYVDDWKLDNYGTAYAIINPGQKYKVVIEGHADEISWYVNYINEKGFLSVIRNGGSDPVIAPAKRVNIFTKKGIVKGIFGWPAIHVRKGKAKDFEASMNNIFIDVGAKNKEEVLKMGIHVGSVVTFDDELMELNKKFFVGRALDNRVGGFCIAEVARMIKDKNIDLPYSLYIVNAVQEEVGLRGAQMITETIQPDVAIVVDVTHDTSTPMMDSKVQGDVHAGKGPTVTYAPAVHNTLRDLIIDAAEENNIPFQREASSRVTGTDTDAFAYSNGGVPSALISLPLRYMHTTVEMLHREDIVNTTKLIFESLRKIEGGMDFRYF